MSYNLIDIQFKLKSLGYYHGKVDGISGPITMAAIVDFKFDRGLPNTSLLGPLTLAALFDQRSIIASRDTVEIKTGKIIDPIWLRIAKTYLDVEEIEGYQHNPIILGWWKRLGLNVFDDETPWCSAFVGGCLSEAGLLPSHSGMARSYEQWGVRLPGPALGAVATMWRGSKASGSGHVTLVCGQSKSGALLGLGGNQSNKVTIAAFKTDRITGYFYPSSYPIPKLCKLSNLPIINNNGYLLSYSKTET
jgi:uncharacterized protein (TIGR02594 family)